MKLSEIDETIFYKLQEQIGSDSDIARMIGCSRQAVGKKRKQLNIPPFQSHKRKRNVQIIQMSKDGFKGVDIAQTFKMSVSQVYRILKGS